MRAKLFGWITVMQTYNETKEEIDSLYSYLVLRYYGQAPVMPWAFLPNEYVSWQPVGDSSARGVITHPGLTGNYLLTFTKDGKIEHGFWRSEPPLYQRPMPALTMFVLRQNI